VPRVEQVVSVYDTVFDTIARHPRVDARHAGDQTEDIEDEDGEVERKDAEQLDVAPDESVPRLEVAARDAVAGSSFPQD